MTLDAQRRSATGVQKILDNWRTGSAQTPSDIVVADGECATKAYGQREKK